MGFIGVLYVSLSIVLYEVIIQIISTANPILDQIATIQTILVKSGNLTEINLLHNECDKLYETIADDSVSLYRMFQVIQVFSVLNCTFMLQHFVTFIFAKKLTRSYEFPQIIQFTDLSMSVASVIIFDWVQYSLKIGLYSDPNLTEAEFEMRVNANFEEYLVFKFEYFFSVIITCLIIRIAVVL